MVSVYKELIIPSHIITKTLKYNFQKKGRPRKSTEDIIFKICEMTLKIPTILALKIRNELSSEENIKISPITVNEYRKNLDFNYKYLK